MRDRNRTRYTQWRGAGGHALTAWKGKNEAWLRDILFKYPEIIPISHLDDDTWCQAAVGAGGWWWGMRARGDVQRLTLYPPACIPLPDA